MQFQQLEPQSQFGKFMDKYTVPILVVVVGTVLGAILLGKIFLVDFNLVMFGWGVVLTLIVIYYVWQFFRTRRNLQNIHNANVAAANQEIERMKQEHLKIIQSERNLFDQWQQNFVMANETKMKSFEKIIEEQKQTIENMNLEINSLRSRANNIEGAYKGHLENHTTERKRI